MFTGLIEKTGTLLAVEKHGDGYQLKIGHSAWKEALVSGESVAVDGVCVSVTSMSDLYFTADLLGETMTRTCFSRTRPGRKVNLERALRAGDRMGGHILSGHVDAVGTVSQVTRVGRDWAMTVRYPESLRGEIVPKGSIACHGVSLTVVSVSDCEFTVHLIPLTYENTNLHELVGGSPINLETDILGKYVRRFLQPEAESSLTMEKLQKAGFLDRSV